MSDQTFVIKCDDCDQLCPCPCDAKFRAESTPECDWCENAAALSVTYVNFPEHSDYACLYHFIVHFGAPIAAGEKFTVESY